jgi:ComF family protein
MLAWALAALDLVFPALCPACDTPLGSGRRDPLCGPCWSRIPRLGPAVCDRCGIPLDGACDGCGIPLDGACAPGASGRGPEICPACRVDPPEFDRARGAGLYAGPLRRALHALKFRGRRSLGRPLADLICEQCLPVLRAGGEVLVPVPLARARLRERGFNQAEVIAERLGATLDLPVRHRWLARVRDTAPQTDLAAAARIANVDGAFVARRAVAGRHVILVDDVLTTGATSRACARALRAAGASRVDVVTAARVAPMSAGAPRPLPAHRESATMSNRAKLLPHSAETGTEHARATGEGDPRWRSESVSMVSAASAAYSSAPPWDRRTSRSWGSTTSPTRRPWLTS